MGIKISDMLKNPKQAILELIALAIAFFFGLLVKDVPEILKTIAKSLPPLTLLLLAILFLLLAIFFAFLYFLSKPSTPNVIKGKLGNLSWIAEINYIPLKVNRPVDIQIKWLCPIHRIPMGWIANEVGRYTLLLCEKCASRYSIILRQSNLTADEANSIVRRQILQKIKLPEPKP